MRRLTRISLRGLFFIIVVIASGCWWVLWPDATAQRFVRQCGSAPVPDPELLGVCWPSYHLTGFHEMLRRAPDQVKIEPQQRTLEDISIGRRRYVTTGDRGRFRFTVTRGKIITGPTAAPVYGGQEFMLDVF